MSPQKRAATGIANVIVNGVVIRNQSEDAVPANGPGLAGYCVAVRWLSPAGALIFNP